MIINQKNIDYIIEDLEGRKEDGEVVDTIIIHCSASEKGDAQQIHVWHKDRGFSQIGYHYVILNGTRCFTTGYVAEDDGEIEEGRELYLVGAHAVGNNRGSIGICLIGAPTYIADDPSRFFTEKQIASLSILIKTLSDCITKVYNITNINIIGHNEVANKICPGFFVQKWLKSIK